MLIDSPCCLLHGLLCHTFIPPAGISITSSNRRTLLNECMDDDVVTPHRNIVQVKNEKLLKHLIR